jgi:hypothetical protein
MTKFSKNPLRQEDKITEKDLSDELIRFETQIKQSTIELVKQQVDGSLRTYKVAAAGFAAGFALFLTIGFLSKGQLFEIVIKSAYPPENIHNDIKPKLSSTVWSTVASGTKEDYERFISRDEFYEALREYHTDLVKSFLLPTRDRAIRASEIVKIGQTPIDANILMVGREFDNKPTSRCHQTFKDNEAQAIVVIPNTADSMEFAWLDCAFGWPQITLRVQSGSKEFSNIKLVGVRRNGKTPHLQVLLSQEAARQLDLSGWRQHKANSFGKVRVASAE